MMSNLLNLNCYLGGPIEFRKESFHSEQTKEYFKHGKYKLLKFLNEKKIKVIDPNKLLYNGVSEIKNRKQMFKDKNFKKIRQQMKVIVRKDLRCVDLSDFIITTLHKDIKTTGSYHEIINCDLQKKPSLIFCPEGIEYIPAWLFGIIPLEFMFDSIDKVINYLEKIDNLQENDFHNHDRWQFVFQSLEKQETGF